MAATTRRQAEHATLDRREFFLDDEAHRDFIALLDKPWTLPAEVRARLNRKAPWEV
jgi:uncharacterized protein (DUF1778 family)